MLRSAQHTQKTFKDSQKMHCDWLPLLSDNFLRRKPTTVDDTHKMALKLETIKNSHIACNSVNAKSIQVVARTRFLSLAHSGRRSLCKWIKWIFFSKIVIFPNWKLWQIECNAWSPMSECRNDLDCLWIIHWNDSPEYQMNKLDISSLETFFFSGSDKDVMNADWMTNVGLIIGPHLIDGDCNNFEISSRYFYAEM